MYKEMLHAFSVLTRPIFFFFWWASSAIDVTTQLHYKHHTHNKAAWQTFKRKTDLCKAHGGREEDILPIVSLLSLNYFLLYHNQN